MTMLNRWVKQKQDIFSKNQGVSKEKAEEIPTNPMKVTDLMQCEEYRKKINGNVVRKVSMIQNGALPDGKLMELNDDINKFLTQRESWERRIKQLGGPDDQQEMQIEASGSTVNGYRYFGAAKNLPQVKSLLES